MGRPSRRLIDGVWHELHTWLVVEERADGVPVTLRLCQPDETVEQCLVAARLCTQEEIDSGEAQKRLNVKMHLMWTPQTWIKVRQ